MKRTRAGGKRYFSWRQGVGEEEKGRDSTNCLFLCATFDYSCVSVTHVTHVTMTPSHVTLSKTADESTKHTG